MAGQPIQDAQAGTDRRPLVLGADGQVGRELMGTPLPPSLTLAGLVRLDADIADANGIARLLDRLEPTVPFNCAAYIAVDRAEAESEAAMRANATGPAVLAEACARRAVPLIHLSTDYVFDSSKPEPYVEADPIAPLGTYGASKAASEAAIRERHSLHLVLRTAWVYGVHGHNFLKTMLRLAGERDS